MEEILDDLIEVTMVVESPQTPSQFPGDLQRIDRILNTILMYLERDMEANSNNLVSLSVVSASRTSETTPPVPSKEWVEGGVLKLAN